MTTLGLVVVEGIDLTLTSLRAKRQKTQRQVRRPAVELLVQLETTREDCL
ncbi:hypothetical protein QQM39_16640 [Streptomyces sp. DT2A-34]|nr:hypothetical protein [Streptomyces sp. DT2A-34]MDO0912416.1 hypothetical protein [Streptomyces sp. DT2A-34]